MSPREKQPFLGTRKSTPSLVRDQVTRAIPSARTARRPFAHSPVESTDSSLAQWSAIARPFAHTARRPYELFAKDVAARIRSLISAKTVRFSSLPHLSSGSRHNTLWSRSAQRLARCGNNGPQPLRRCVAVRGNRFVRVSPQQRARTFYFFFLIFRPCVVHFRTRNTNSAPVGKHCDRIRRLGKDVRFSFVPRTNLPVRG